MLSLSPNDHLMHIDQTSWPMRSFRLTSPLLERKCKWDSSLLVCIWSPFMLFWCLPSQVISYRDLSLSVIPNRLTVGDLGSRLLIKFLKSGLSLAWTTQEWMPSSANRFERITTTTTKIIRELRQRSLDYLPSGYVTKEHPRRKRRTQSLYLCPLRQCLNSFSLVEGGLS